MARFAPVLCSAILALAGLVQTAPARATAGYTTTVTNFNSAGQQVTRFDTNGNSVDAHDGELVQFGGTYYLYGTSYDCGFRWNTPSAPFCGFKTYSSTDLVHWVDRGAMFDANTTTWQTRCNGATYGCFRPHVVYNPSTAQYVLWINVYDNQNGYRVFTSSSPSGPFVEQAEPTVAVNNDAPVKGVNNGDQALFVDSDDIAYLVYTDWVSGGELVVERLTSTYLSGTGDYTRLNQSRTEAPALFKRGSTYYLTYSDPNCGYCTTGTSYKTASNPLGPWSSGTSITTTSCGGQPAFVAPIATTNGTTYIYGSDLWNNGAANEALANYFWTPLTFSSDGGIMPLTCPNTFTLTLSDGAAGQQVLPQGTDQQDGVDGFRTYCDIGSSVARFQTFVPSYSGTLTSLTYTTFQSCEPNADLELTVYWASSDNDPIGNPMYNTTIPASQIGWSPRNITITPNVAVNGNWRYGVKISTAATSGCYGLSYNDANLYPAGGESYSLNGSPWSLETDRSLKFSTSME